MRREEFDQLRTWLRGQRERARHGRLVDVLARLELAGLTAGIEGGRSVISTLREDLPGPALPPG